MKNKIKIAILTCISGMLLLGGSMNVCAEGLLSIGVSAGNIKTGETVTITVYANDENNVDVVSDMNVTYDTGKLEYINCSSEATYGGGVINTNASTARIQFKAIGSGDAYIKAEGPYMVAAGTHIMVSNPSATTGEPQSEETVTTTNDISDTQEEPESAETSANESGDALVINGVNYHISEEFTEEDIPDGFFRADFEYKGDPYQGVKFESGHLGMYYLVNEEGEGRFFVYDADRDGFYPFVRLSSGDHFIILMVIPNGAIPPDDYEPKSLTIDDVEVTAYQYTGGEDHEIVILDEAEGNGGLSTFYVVFAMDDTGIAGWYQYDSVQGTYQRLNEELFGPEDGGENYDVLLESYNELSERHKETKIGDRRIIAVMIFVSVVLLFVVINLLLKIRELKADYEEEEDEEDEDAEVESSFFVDKTKTEIGQRKTRKPEMSFAKELDEEELDFDMQNKVTTVEKEEEADKEKKIVKVSAEEEDIDEFEENPSVLSRRMKKKEKKVNKVIVSNENVENNDDDDDIVFLDLNDM